MNHQPFGEKLQHLVKPLIAEADAVTFREIQANPSKAESLIERLSEALEVAHDAEVAAKALEKADLPATADTPTARK
jgi:hypothetical protein